MPSTTEPIAPGPSGSASRFDAWFARWNRKLHFYSGLFLLFFLWLFAFSGLLLNHSNWISAQFWKSRKETNFERELAAPGPEVKGDLPQAREIMAALDIAGEILWTTTRTSTDLFEFQVRRPGHYFFISADFVRKRVKVRQANVNLWGVMQALHSFTGAPMDDPRNTRDWALTTIWAYSMDAVAAGMIFMVLSSLYMWLQLPQKRLPGAVALAMGSLICGLFCLGLRWLF